MGGDHAAVLATAWPGTHAAGIRRDRTPALTCINVSDHAGPIVSAMRRRPASAWREWCLSDPILVLVVDDSVTIRVMMQRVLQEDRGIAVSAAASAAEAEAMMAVERFDVVTLDVEMPGMGGLELLDRLMQRHAVPVIMLSASTGAGAGATARAAALRAGAVGCFDKADAVREASALRRLVKAAAAGKARISAADRATLLDRPAASLA